MSFAYSSICYLFYASYSEKLCDCCRQGPNIVCRDVWDVWLKAKTTKESQVTIEDLIPGSRWQICFQNFRCHVFTLSCLDTVSLCLVSVEYKTPYWTTIFLENKNLTLRSFQQRLLLFTVGNICPAKFITLNEIWITWSKKELAKNYSQIPNI